MRIAHTLGLSWYPGEYERPGIAQSLSSRELAEGAKAHHTRTLEARREALCVPTQTESHFEVQPNTECVVYNELSFL